MTQSAQPLSFTDIEIRSYLPSGWGVQPGATGRWNAGTGTWTIDVYDVADNVWPLTVDSRTSGDRVAALRTAIDRLVRKGLGRKSILTG